MRLVTAAVITTLVACTDPPAETTVVGTWKRAYPDTQVIDELSLAADGSFVWTSHVREHSAVATGSYTLVGDDGLTVDDPHAPGGSARLTIAGTTNYGVTFSLRATIALDEHTLALGAYIPAPDDSGPAYVARWDWTDATNDVYSWEIMPEMWMHTGSFGVVWIDPIWKTQKSEGGYYVETVDAFVLDEDFTFSRIGDAFVRDQGWHAGLAHTALWWDLGLVLKRVP